MSEKLNELAVRVEKSSVPEDDAFLVRDLCRAFRGRDDYPALAVPIENAINAGCVTAAIKITETLLPLCEWELTTTGFKPGATVIPNGSVHGGSYASTPARALLAASLRALELPHV